MTRTRTRSLLVLALAALVVMSLGLLAACGSSTSDTTASTAASGGETATTAAPSTDGGGTADGDFDGTFDGELTIGCITSLTGAAAMAGAEIKWGREAAAADINAAGGIKLADGTRLELKLKFLDDKSITNEAAAAMEKAVKAEGLKFVLSSTDTPMSQAAGTVADKYDVCFLAEHFWANLARDHDFANTAVFFPTPEGIVSIPLKAMELHPEADRPTRLAMVTQDNADGQGMGDAIKALGPQYGFEDVMVESVTPGTKDVSSVVLKLKQKDIDCLFVFSTPADGITFLKQMKDQDYSPKYVFGWMGFWTTEFMKGLGADSDYVGHDAFWSEKLPYEGAAELGQRYRDDHDGIDSVSIGQYYAGVQIMVEAIERAGVAEPQAVLAELTNATFDTIHGVIEFDAQKVADTEFLGMQWLNGERIINYPDVGTPINWFVPWKDR